MLYTLYRHRVRKQQPIRRRGQGGRASRGHPAPVFAIRNGGLLGHFSQRFARRPRAWWCIPTSSSSIFCVSCWVPNSNQDDNSSAPALSKLDSPIEHTRRTALGKNAWYCDFLHDGLPSVDGSLKDAPDVLDCVASVHHSASSCMLRTDDQFVFNWAPMSFTRILAVA